MLVLAIYQLSKDAVYFGAYTEEKNERHVGNAHCAATQKYIEVMHARERNVGAYNPRCEAYSQYTQEYRRIRLHVELDTNEEQTQQVEENIGKTGCNACAYNAVNRDQPMIG